MKSGDWDSNPGKVALQATAVAAVPSPRLETPPTGFEPATPSLEG